jgi:hypothetical protein
MNALLLAALLAAGQAHAPVVHATDIRADFNDKLTDQFVDALRKALAKAKHMKPEGGDDAPDLYLTFLLPVTQDGNRFEYAIDLMKSEENSSPDRLASLTGICRQAAIDVCAQGVIGKADKAAGKD